MNRTSLCSVACASFVLFACARSATTHAVLAPQTEPARGPVTNAPPAQEAPAQESPALKAARSAKLAYADGRFAGAWLEVAAVEDGVRLAWQKALVPLGPRAPAGFEAGDEPGRISTSSAAGLRCTWFFTGRGGASLSVHVDLNTNAADPGGIIGTYPWFVEGLKEPRAHQEVLRVKSRPALLDRESGAQHTGLALELAQKGLLVVEGWGGVDRELLVRVAEGLDLEALDAAAKRDVPATSDAPAAFDAFTDAARKGQHGRAYVARERLLEQLAALANERLEPLLPREVAGWTPEGTQPSGDRGQVAVWSTFRRGENQEFTVTLRPIAAPAEDGRRAALNDPAQRQPGDQVIDFKDRKALWRANELFVHLAGDRFLLSGRGTNVDANEWIQALVRVLDLARLDAVLGGLR